MEALARSRGDLMEEVSQLAHSSGRATGAVRVVAVTKSVSAEVAAALVRDGATDLGESRTDEFEHKYAYLEGRGLRPRWHFIGHLQRNKARRVLKLADVIHSVHSERLLKHLAELALQEERRPRIYLQVKLSPEAEKSGFAPEAIPAAIELAGRHAANLGLAGLMTMAPRPGTNAEEDSAQASATFRKLAELASTLETARFEGGRVRLSMGMSGDYPEAIAAGADLVRIGSAFFPALPKDEPKYWRRSG